MFIPSYDLDTSPNQSEDEQASSTIKFSIPKLKNETSTKGSRQSIITDFGESSSLLSEEYLEPDSLIGQPLSHFGSMSTTSVFQRGHWRSGCIEESSEVPRTTPELCAFGNEMQWHDDPATALLMSQHGTNEAISSSEALEAQSSKHRHSYREEDAYSCSRSRTMNKLDPVCTGVVARKEHKSVELLQGAALDSNRCEDAWYQASAIEICTMLKHDQPTRKNVQGRPSHFSQASFQNDQNGLSPQMRTQGPCIEPLSRVPKTRDQDARSPSVIKGTSLAHQILT